MRNVILLHARANAALAEELVSRNARVALTCGVDRAVPPGRFGEQFHIVAMWSREAARDGLEWVMAEALTGRERETVVLVMGDVQVPSCLSAAGLQVRVTPMTDLAALFETLAPRAAAVESDMFDERLGGRRRTVATAATAALSIGCGALLAHAASPYGLVPTVATPTFTPTARVTPAVDPTASLPESLPVIEAVDARFNAVRAAAAEVAASPVVNARFERVKSLAISDLLLAQLAQKADAQSDALFSTAAPVAKVAVADVAPVRFATATDMSRPIMVAVSDTPSETSRF